jgi:hypothetical protein
MDLSIYAPHKFQFASFAVKKASEEAIYYFSFLFVVSGTCANNVSPAVKYFMKMM